MGSAINLGASLPRHYLCAREVVNERLREAIRDRADHHNKYLRSHYIKAGDQVWLSLSASHFENSAKVGYARKIAHLWHVPFRVAEMIDEHAERLEIAGTEYRIFPIVHVSKLTLVRLFPCWPKQELGTRVEGCVDFDEALLPDDSWEREVDDDKYEVEKTIEVRPSRKTRYGCNCREFLGCWKGYDEPTWVDEVSLNRGALLREFEISQISRRRFGVMQSHEEEMGRVPSH
ncbi:hypothetical protein PHMEG_00031169 [Phytophthora megakarya]|uniref:Chromo domain-containing protein n=1 Tax=Phytophthora megakarya TaxID=4795 RepID=A0A225UZD0_9STRA|nr:hypothetical protein PHMEG_00031169 [Phytophthora megakarya]